MRNDLAIWFIIITILLLYLYNTGRFAAIRKVIEDKTYQYNFGLSQGIKVADNAPTDSGGDIFQSISQGLSDITAIAGLFA